MESTIPESDSTLCSGLTVSLAYAYNHCRMDEYVEFFAAHLREPMT